MIPRVTLVLLAALAACGGAPGPAASARPKPSPEETVRSFMQAAADSNLTRMAELWGTRAGSAAKTGQPPDYERRMAIMRFYLSGSPFRVLPGAAAEIARVGGDTARGRLPGPGDEAANTRQVVVQLDRQGCAKYVPFVVLKAADDSWLINQVDIAAAGHPMRPCTMEKTGKDST